MISKQINPEEVKAFLDTCGSETKVYLGCDSERYRVDGIWWDDFTLAVVIHIDGSRGCKIFGEMQTERDYDQKKNRPSMRLMNEVYKVSDLFWRLADVISDYETEIHLDLNPNEKHGSSCVVNQAIGYIKGTCNVTPMVKPNAFAASYCADRLKDIMSNQKAA